MLIDVRELSGDEIPAAEVCIVGAGAAGITLALELEAAGRDVVLLESGGFDYDDDTQDLYSGESINPAFIPLDVTRLRYLGGSTNHWYGRCPPLSPIDFEPRDWIPESGWPLTFEDLRPYYERASPYLELRHFAHRAEDWRGPDWPELPLSDEVITTEIALRSPPTRFGEVFRSRLERAEHVRAYLHANCIAIDTDDDGRAVRGLQVATLDGRRLSVRARRFVLAAGGIEVPRLLLQPHATNPEGLGNGRGLVGRYFSDHPGVTSGTVLFSSPQPSLKFFTMIGRRAETRFQRFLGVAPEVQRRERLLNCGFGLVPTSDWHDSPASDSFQALRTAVRERRWPEDLGFHLGRVIGNIDHLVARGWHRLRGTVPERARLGFWSELPPIADSRITLLPERDALGLQRVRLDWRVPEVFERTFHRAHELLGQELGRQGLGRLQLDEDVAADLQGSMRNSHHHMGATRMHEDPRRGVVDPDCRVHELANLYIAGSAVYPTYGHANPTLTIVALAIRLADHLKEQAG